MVFEVGCTIAGSPEKWDKVHLMRESTCRKPQEQQQSLQSWDIQVNCGALAVGATGGARTPRNGVELQ